MRKTVLQLLTFSLVIVKVVSSTFNKADTSCGCAETLC